VHVNSTRHSFRTSASHVFISYFLDHFSSNWCRTNSVGIVSRLLAVYISGRNKVFLFSEVSEPTIRAHPAFSAVIRIFSSDILQPSNKANRCTVPPSSFKVILSSVVPPLFCVPSLCAQQHLYHISYLYSSRLTEFAMTRVLMLCSCN
jgi:hypothetical protein